MLGTGPANGVLSLNADGSFTYTPNANFNGVDTFTYRANDGTVNSALATVTITVNPVNDTPVANADAYATNEDTPLVIAAAGVLANDTDVDADPLSAVLGTGPANGVLSLNADGSFTYTPNANFNGVDTFTYRANDGTVTTRPWPPSTRHGGQDPASTTPRWPTPTPTPTSEDTPLVIAAAGVLANDTDVDADPLSAVLGTGPANGVLSLNADGSFTYTPNANFNGVDTFTYRANDGTVNSALATVTITVNPVNDTPVANADAYAGNEDTPLVIAAAGVLANDTDVDARSAQRGAGHRPRQRRLEPQRRRQASPTPRTPTSTASIPSPTAPTTARVNSALATVTITVTPVNDTPVANDDAPVPTPTPTPPTRTPRWSSPPPACSPTTPTSMPIRSARCWAPAPPTAS